MNKKILIVEDDTYLRDLYEEVLKEDGFSVKIAVDGEEGLVTALEGGHDLILLDIMMPKLDGLGFLKSLKKKNALSKNGPIILLTNLAHDPVIKEGLDLGAKDFIVKSEITPDDLVKKVKDYLK